MRLWLSYKKFCLLLCKRVIIIEHYFGSKILWTWCFLLQGSQIGSWTFLTLTDVFWHWWNNLYLLYFGSVRLCLASSSASTSASLSKFGLLWLKIEQIAGEVLEEFRITILDYSIQILVLLTLPLILLHLNFALLFEIFVKFADSRRICVIHCNLNRQISLLIVPLFASLLTQQPIKHLVQLVNMTIHGVSNLFHPQNLSSLFASIDWLRNENLPSTSGFI